MNFLQIKIAVSILGAAGALFISGCATAFVRSENTRNSPRAFPATAFDGEVFCESVIKGVPLGMVQADPNASNGPVARFACAVGVVIDLPFSIVSDTLLLPVDLNRSRTPATKSDAKGEPDPPAHGSQPAGSNSDRMTPPDGSPR